MKIVQLISNFYYGDASGNDAAGIQNILRSHGYSTQLYAGQISGYKSDCPAKALNLLPHLEHDDIAILHLGGTSPLNGEFAGLSCRKILRYHNITPPCFFSGTDPDVMYLQRCALGEMRELGRVVDSAMADSSFNKSNLEKAGYSCPVKVVPVVVNLDDFDKEPDYELMERFKERELILFTGRITPNKAQEDIIAAFSVYKKYYSKDALLVLAGGYAEGDLYQHKLEEYTALLGLKSCTLSQTGDSSLQTGGSLSQTGGQGSSYDVIFTGKIAFPKLLSFYRMAKLFLCMSRHEGFCVPLLEAMKCSVPVIARNCAAVPETMGGSGIVFDADDPRITAGLMHRVITDDKLRRQIIAEQHERLKDFSYEKTEKAVLGYIEGLEL